MIRSNLISANLNETNQPEKVLEKPMEANMLRSKINFILDFA